MNNTNITNNIINSIKKIKIYIIHQNIYKKTT